MIYIHNCYMCIYSLENNAIKTCTCSVQVTWVFGGFFFEICWLQIWNLSLWILHFKSQSFLMCYEQGIILRYNQLPPFIFNLTVHWDVWMAFPYLLWKSLHCCFAGEIIATIHFLQKTDEAAVMRFDNIYTCEWLNHELWLVIQ